MSFTPFQPDPNAYRLNLPPFNYPGVPKGIPTSGGIADSQHQPVMVHAPAVGTEMPAASYSLPNDSSNKSASSGNQTDPYVQSLQTAIQADQNLVNHPYQAPQYKPPAKGLEYLAMGLGLLFPGSPIAGMASGAASGLYQRSQDQYKRAEDQEENRVSGLERTAQIENQIADAQGAIQQREDAVKQRREATDMRHSEVLSRLEQQSHEFQQTYVLKSKSLQARVAYQNGELANMAARNTITQQDAQLASSTRYQVAVLQQAGADRRNLNNAHLRGIIAQAQQFTTQTDAQLRSIDSAVAAGADPAAAQTQAASLIAANSARIQKLLGDAATAAPNDPSLAGLGTLGAPAPGSDTSWPQPAAPGATPPITINVNPNGGTVAPANGMTLPGETTTLNETPPAPTAGAAPFPGHPSLGHGQGIAAPTFKAALDHYTQAAGQFKSADDVLHDIASSPGGAMLSAPQLQQIVQTWEKTQAAHAQQHANPQAASTKGATAQKPAPENPAWGQLGGVVNAVEHYFDPLGKALHQATQGSEMNKPIVQPAHAAEEKPQTVLDAVTAAAMSTKGLGEPGVPLLRALVAAESGDNPAAQSGAGAIGLGQLMPGTAKELGVNPNDPRQNLEGSAKYLAQLLQQFHSIPLALAAYNAGPGAVEKYHGIPPYPETQAYVQRVLGLYRQLTRR